jgi:hypothetical protein
VQPGWSASRSTAPVTTCANVCTGDQSHLVELAQFAGEPPSTVEIVFTQCNGLPRRSTRTRPPATVGEWASGVAVVPDLHIDEKLFLLFGQDRLFSPLQQVAVDAVGARLS